MKMMSKCLFLVFIVKSIFISSVICYVSLSSLTESGIYNAGEMPKYTTDKGTNAPVTVIVGVEISHGSDTNSNSSLISLKLQFVWRDSRLKHKSSSSEDYLYSTSEERIWSPPLTLLVEEEVISRVGFSYLKIYPNSTVVWNIMQNLELRKFGTTYSPRELSIRLMSLNYTKDHLKLEWDAVDPLVLLDGWSTSFFITKNNIQVEAGSLHVTRPPRGQGGDHSCLKILVHNRAFISSSVLTVYIPGILAVMISWVVFWMEITSTLGRAAILLACLLHLFIQKVSIEKDLSLLGNIRTLNAWLEGCLGFVFAAFFEMVCVTFLYRISDRRYTTRKEEERFSAATTIQEEEEEGIVEGSDGEANTLCNHFYFPRIWLNRFPSTPDAINAICRVVFPLCFVIFLCVFFAAEY